MTLMFGANAPTSGWTDRAKATAIAGRMNAIVWLPSAGPQDALWVNANIGPALHVVRLDTPRPSERADAYVDRVAGTVLRWWDVPNVCFQPGNEPTIDAGWSLDSWLFAAHEYTLAMKVRLPGIRLTSVPLKVEETRSLTLDAVRDCDYVSVHSYIEAPHWDDIDNEGLGASWKTALRFGAPIIVSEFGCVGGHDAHVIIHWAEEMEAAGVVAAMLFILDGLGTRWASFDIAPELAAAIRAGLSAPLPPPSPPPEPTTSYTRDYDPRGYVPLDARWRDFIAQRNPDEARAICDAYDGSCREIGYDANAAIAQGAVETAVFTSQRWRNAHNAAGIGIYSDGTPDIIWGPPPHGDVATGIHAQADLLTDYFTDGSEPFGTLAPHGFGGMTLHKTSLRGLDGIWAADTSYSAAIVQYMNNVLTGDAQPPAPTPSSGVRLEDVYRVSVGFIGRTQTEERQPEFLWCEQVIEEEEQDAGLPRINWPSAADRGEAYVAAGRMRQGIPPRGAGLLWDLTFEPRGGHAARAADYPMVITTYYTGRIELIDARENGWYDSPGYLGWYTPDGASEAEDDTLFIVDGQIDDGRLDAIWFGTDAPTKTAKAKMPRVKGHGIPDRWEKEFRAGRSLGKATTPEKRADNTGAMIQYFQSGWIVWYPADGSTTVN